MRRFLIVLASVLNLLLVDAVVKELAARHLKGVATVPVIPGIFDLAYVENRGCAWGMFQGQVWPLAVFGLIALAFLIWKRKDVFGLTPPYSSHPKRAKLLKPSPFGFFAEPMLYAGILGNVIDRLFRGYVIDMFDFHWGIHHFPCFNVADTLICVSVWLLFLASFVQPMMRKSS